MAQTKRFGEKIVFHIEPENKKALRQIAKEKGLGVSTYCRFIILKTLGGRKEENATAT
ncbi:MAG: hypothetical protein KJ718_01680 [Nanoarchaeota archaeon]|nr:hypothetical protein [Nanoarchaeota archaeon]MBU1051244.1 hypothetical protein [Nanoarchaeota archaeon]